jgi:hypothetical protein
MEMHRLSGLPFSLLLFSDIETERFFNNTVCCGCWNPGSERCALKNGSGYGAALSGEWARLFLRSGDEGVGSAITLISP